MTISRHSRPSFQYFTSILKSKTDHLLPISGTLQYCVIPPYIIKGNFLSGHIQLISGPQPLTAILPKAACSHSVSELAHVLLARVLLTDDALGAMAIGT